MADVAIARALDDVGDSPVVPESLRIGVTRRIRGAQKIVIAFEPAPKTTRTIAQIKLTCEADALPAEDIDEITEEIVRKVETHYQEFAEDSEELSYRIVFHCHLKERGSEKKKLHRLSFSLAYAAKEGITHASEEDVALEKEDQQREVNRMLMVQNDRLFERLDKTVQHICDIANQAEALTKPIIDSCQYMGQMWLTGATMTQNALAMMFDMKKVEAEIEAKNRRYDMVLKHLEPALKVGMEQFMAYVQMRAGLTPTVVFPERKGRRASQAQPAAANSDEAQAANTAPEAEEPKMPTLCEFARNFGATVQVEQWSKLAQLLTKRELGMVLELFKAESDDAVTTYYEKILDGGIEQAKLPKLMLIFDDEQRRGFDIIRQLVERSALSSPPPGTA